MIRDALFKLITTDADCAALVTTRVYPDKLPQNPKFPSLVYQIVTAPRDYTHDGASGLVDATFRFTIYGPTVAKSALVKTALVALLGGYSGSVDLPGPVTVEIHGAFCVNETELPESPLEVDGPLNITRLWQDFNLWYREG